jgi:DDE superfamily endonuclease
MSHKHFSTATEHFNKLIQFRQAAYANLGNAKDALFELSDAVIDTPSANSFAELSCSEFFRRQWPSAYEALQDGRLDRKGLMKLYCQQINLNTRPTVVGDHTAWPRPSAYTLADRTVEHQPTPIPGNRPITLGHGYSTLVWTPESKGSWALPLLHERISSQETSFTKASQQLRAVQDQLSMRAISLWDAEYGCAPFLLATADIPTDKIIRLRPNLNLAGPPGPYKGRGRHPVHGDKFKFKDPQTWKKPESRFEMSDPDLGKIQVMIWRDLHFRKAATCPFIVARLERLENKGTRRLPKVIWVAWIGEEPPEPDTWWQRYMRRYTVDHWYRFAKQRLYWTLPMFGTPEQGERWSDLMPLITWELWMARPIGVDKPLPWQKKQLAMTPGRVCQGMSDIFTKIGTPAQMPKPRGNAPGWQKGRSRTRRTRFEVVKRRHSQNEKAVLAA